MILVTLPSDFRGRANLRDDVGAIDLVDDRVELGQHKVHLRQVPATPPQPGSGIVLLWGPRRPLFLMSEIPL